MYQDRPCPRITPVLRAAKKEQTQPLGIHDSWFALPTQADGRAFCDRRGCECGRIERKHVGGLLQSVADSLYLDGNWHRYEAAYQLWYDSPSTSAESYLKRQDMLEASCELMMSQQLLRDFANDVLKVLKKKVRLAEELGFDRQEPCNQGIAEACDHYDAIKLYDQMLKDAHVLKKLRVSTVISDQETER